MKRKPNRTVLCDDFAGFAETIDADAVWWWYTHKLRAAAGTKVTFLRSRLHASELPWLTNATKTDHD